MCRYCKQKKNRAPGILLMPVCKMFQGQYNILKKRSWNGTSIEVRQMAALLPTPLMIQFPGHWRILSLSTEMLECSAEFWLSHASEAMSIWMLASDALPSICDEDESPDDSVSAGRWIRSWTLSLENEKKTVQVQQKSMHFQQPWEWDGHYKTDGKQIMIASQWRREQRRQQILGAVLLTVAANSEDVHWCFKLVRTAKTLTETQQWAQHPALHSKHCPGDWPLCHSACNAHQKEWVNRQRGKKVKWDKTDHSQQITHFQPLAWDFIRHRNDKMVEQPVPMHNQSWNKLSGKIWFKTTEAMSYISSSSVLGMPSRRCTTADARKSKAARDSSAKQRIKDTFMQNLKQAKFCKG